jgi:bifunctional UDP-N-acetylglucosamine pyrophosphorylase/glucosamine-1-phosphate N-acetyltransferase
MKLSVIILAAGDGKRMYSDIPKTLHELAGKPLIQHVVDTAQQLKPNNIYVVYGKHGGKQMVEQLNELPVTWVHQPQPLGTGHAAQQVLSLLKPDHRVLVLCGDVPLISAETLATLIKITPESSIGWLTAYVDDPAGLGRILRDDEGNLQAIVEERDANATQKAINEINTGICLLPVKYLSEWLPKLDNKNTQQEYYLTDIFAKALANNIQIVTTQPTSTEEILGVNDKSQLAQLERIWQLNNAKKYMQDGLTLRDPTRFDVRGTLQFGRDVICDVNVMIEGDVVIGDNSYIGPNVYLRNVTIANDVKISANTVIDTAVIAEGCLIGPFARIRPATILQKKVKIGNFVEIKKSEIGEKSKVNHLSYIGDTFIGKNVNIGAGTITCNYDGVNKHKTTIEDDVFIGSSTQLIAPLTVGKNATIGAGSTITDDVPSDDLTLTRAKQITVEGWHKPKKETTKE